MSLGVQMDMPTALFDNLQVSRRVDIEATILSFFQVIPGTGNQRLEIFRGITPNQHMKRMIDVLCRTLDYYPTRDSAKKS